MLRVESSPAAEYGFLRVQKAQCFSNVEEWVARHSSEIVEPVNENMGLEYQTEDLVVEDSSSFPLAQEGHDYGTPKMNSLKRTMTLSELYVMAQATRRAREKETAEDMGQSRSSMLRKAYAVQRELTASLQSEFSMNSAETKSSVEWLLNCRETDPEQLLLNLGFGGPPQGVDRIPKRFLQPSRLNGVEIDKFFQLQEELADVFETGSLGYRGLSGPPTRRPSMIVSRILEKMREQQKEELKRKHSAPPLSTALPCQSVSQLAVAPEQACPIIEEHKEELQDTVVDVGIAALEQRNSIKPQSSLSSRRSSLRKQDHVEEWDDEIAEFPAERPAHPSDNSCSSGFYEHNIQRLPSQDSPQLLPQGRNDSDCDDDVSCTEESAGAVASQVRNMDPVLAVLRVAVQTYKSQLQQRFPAPRRVYDPTDCNHNSIRSDPPGLVALREEIRRELQRTEILLEQCQLQMDVESVVGDVTVSAMLTELANDMAALLERQQLLNSQLQETWPVDAQVGDRETGTAVEKKYSSLVKTVKARKASKRPPEVLRPWLQSFERKLCSLVRSAVRKEMRRALAGENPDTSAASNATT